MAQLTGGRDKVHPPPITKVNHERHRKRLQQNNSGDSGRSGGADGVLFGSDRHYPSQDVVTMTADLIPLDDCKVCGGRGWYKEHRGEYFGMPSWETVHCDCWEERDDAETNQVNKV